MNCEFRQRECSNLQLVQTRTPRTNHPINPTSSNPEAQPTARLPGKEDNRPSLAYLSSTLRQPSTRLAVWCAVPPFPAA